MKNIKLLSWFNFCLDFRIFHAISVIYFAQITGSYAMALGLFSIARISSSVFEIPTGIFSDLIGRKWTIIFGQITTIISVLLYALGFNFWVLVVGAVLEGVGRSFFSGNNSAFLYDTLKENNLEKDFAEYEGRASSMFQFALGVSAILGSFVLGFYSYQIMYWLTLIPLSIGLIISFFFVEPKKHFNKIDTNIFSHFGEALKRFKENKKLQIIAMIETFETGLGEAMYQFIPAFYALLWSAWLIPIANAIAHLFAFWGYRYSGALVKKFGELRVLVYRNTINSFIGIIITAYPTIFTPLIDTISSFGYGLSSVAKSSLLQKEFSDAQRSTMGSITSFFGSLFFGVVSFLLGFWADQVGVVYAILTAQCLTLTTLLMYWKLKKYL